MYQVKTLAIAGLMWVGVAGPALGQQNVRFATFNTSFSVDDAGELLDGLTNPVFGTVIDFRARNVAEIIQRVNPDVLLINEFDYEPSGASIQAFITNYLNVGQNGQAPVDYGHVYLRPSNTGVQPGDQPGVDGSLINFDNDSATSADGDPNDAYGFGEHPGHFGMVLLSKYPIFEAQSRTFQTFLWDDMPNNRIPTASDPSTADPNDGWFTPLELEQFRLSSKSHWDVAIDVNGETVHALASHPTPPVFDGLEDLNGRRNADEIRFWQDYIQSSADPDTLDDDYIYDDQGVYGGIEEGASFVILGDLNADPDEGDGISEAITGLLNDPLVNDPVPTGAGGTDPDDTATFGLRADYAVPSSDLEVIDAGVFWPTVSEPGGTAVFWSDHRLVYVDVVVPEPALATVVMMGAGLLTLRARAR
ncbi:MAG: endonuclease/exonuclease/phosphatase family protein [Planctomycetota bacterium]